MRVDVLTIFPELFAPFLAASLIGKAREKGLLEVRVHDLRDFHSREARQVVPLAQRSELDRTLARAHTRPSPVRPRHSAGRSGRCAPAR